MNLKDNIQKELERFDLNKCLNLEKEFFGFKKNDLVFISAGDFSKFYWCPMQTYFSSKKNELEKYIGFLIDKIEYSILLNQLSLTQLEEIKKENDLIKIGNYLNLDNIFNLLNTNQQFFNKNDENLILAAKKRLKYTKKQTEKGHLYEIIYAKKLPSIHWVKKYKNFIFTCSPDGICVESLRIGKNIIGNIDKINECTVGEIENKSRKFDIGESSLQTLKKTSITYIDYVYEFKSSKNTYFANLNLRKARLQADIYGICFNLDKKLIENYIISTNKKEEYFEDINFKEINNIISKLNKICLGFLPEKPKEEFKCRNCEFKSICKIKY